MAPRKQIWEEDEELGEVDYKDFSPEMVDFIRQAHTEDLICRSARHVWEVLPDDWRIPKGRYKGARLRIYECQRCETKRLDFLTPLRSKVFYRKYLYSDGYIFTGAKDVGGLDKALVNKAINDRRKIGTKLPIELVEDVNKTLETFEVWG